MKLRNLTFIAALMSIVVGLQACGRKYEPQEGCNFVQSGNLQRVSWNDKVPVKMMVHSSVSTEAYPAIEKAVAVWNKQAGRELIKIEMWGAAGSIDPKQDGYNLLYWMTDWEAEKSNEQARTTIYWSGKQIFEADLRINGNLTFNYSTNPEEKVADGAVDLESLLIHEFGHVLGLAHNESAGSVMNFSLATGLRRTAVASIDANAIQCEYK